MPPGDVILAIGLATQGEQSEVLPVALSADAGRIIDLLSSVMTDLERITGSPDVVKAYAMRGLIARPEWNLVIDGATTHLWLHGMAEMGYALDDQVPSILGRAAESGCDIRVLLLDPDFDGTADIDLDEGNPPGTLAPRIRAALAVRSAPDSDARTLPDRTGRDEVPYPALMGFHPTARGRWAIRTKAALNAFDVAFEGRPTVGWNQFKIQLYR